VKKAAIPRFLNAASPLPYHLRAGRYQRFGKDRIAKAAQKPGPMAGGLTHGRIQQKWFSGFASEFAQFKQSLNGGLTMRTYDLTPFYRSTVGFDRLFSLLDRATPDGSPGYPPYNIERTGDNSYRITVAVSGFAQGELSIVAKENTLTIKGEKIANENGKDKSELLYRGIAARAFERAFQLADFVVVKNASLENGLLHVDLVREIPEAKKPRNIPISTGAQSPQVVDGSAEKAAA
jgi:molecular chaperone IbpA